MPVGLAAAAAAAGAVVVVAKVVATRGGTSRSGVMVMVIMTSIGEMNSPLLISPRILAAAVAVVPATALENSSDEKPLGSVLKRLTST